MPVARKATKRILWGLALPFAAVNAMAAFHAHRFTHFTDPGQSGKRRTPADYSFGEKLKALLTGAPNPRPVNTRTPSLPYETVVLHNDKKIECWHISAPEAKGTVILFHGYGSSKSALLDRAIVFHRMGYNTLLADFRGCGGSEGNYTSIGHDEARDVQTCFNYIKGGGESRILLYGPSMGAVAILKAIDEGLVQPSGIILECPFGTMYRTICNRFDMMNVPSFPLAGILGFWGSVENGYWAFSHNPEDYARKASMPALLMWGEKDDRVRRTEIDAVYRSLSGRKTLRTFPQSAHESYLNHNRQEWTEAVNGFIGSFVD